MLKMTKILLSSSLSLTLLGMASLSHAQGYNAYDTSMPSDEFHIGGYAEIGGSFGLLKVFEAKSKDNVNPQQQITAQASESNLTGGLGVSLRSSPKSSYIVNIGLELSDIDSEITREYIDVTNSKYTDGALNMTKGLFTISGECLMGNHLAPYLSLGVGLARYTVESSLRHGSLTDPFSFGSGDLSNYTANGTRVRYSPKYIKPVISIGVGAKIYFGTAKGVYLSADAKYTHVFQEELIIHDEKIIAGIGTVQAEVKLGYQF